MSSTPTLEEKLISFLKEGSGEELYSRIIDKISDLDGCLQICIKRCGLNEDNIKKLNNTSFENDEFLKFKIIVYVVFFSNAFWQIYVANNYFGHFERMTKDDIERNMLEKILSEITFDYFRNDMMEYYSEYKKNIVFEC